MPVTITPTERLRCFEIARVIVADAATIHNGYGIVLQLTNLSELKDKLDEILTGLDDDEKTEVQALVVDWNGCRKKVGKMTGGSVGNVGGVDYSFEDKRKQVKELFQTYVPVMHEAEAIARRQNQTPQSQSVVAQVIRG